MNKWKRSKEAIDKNNKRNSQKRTKRLERFYYHYTRKIGCKICKIKGPRPIFQFDHIDGTTSRQRYIDKPATITIYHCSYFKLKKWFDEIRRCQIICANCHSIKSFNERKILAKKENYGLTKKQKDSYNKTKGTYLSLVRNRKYKRK